MFSRNNDRILNRIIRNKSRILRRFSRNMGRIRSRIIGSRVGY